MLLRPCFHLVALVIMSLSGSSSCIVLAASRACQIAVVLLLLFSHECQRRGRAASRAVGYCLSSTIFIHELNAATSQSRCDARRSFSDHLPTYSADSLLLIVNVVCRCYIRTQRSVRRDAPKLWSQHQLRHREV